MFPQVEALFDAYRSGAGVFGRRHAGQPEHAFLQALPLAERISIITVVATIDYPSEEGALWDSAMRTYVDESTRWVFDLRRVSQSDPETLTRAMYKYRFTGRNPSGNAASVLRVAKTLTRAYNANPMRVIAAYGANARALYDDRKRLGDLPYITGDRAFPFWLRMIGETGVTLKNLARVPLSVGSHVARATFRIIYGRPDRPDAASERDRIQQDWFRICRSVSRPEIYPLALDEPLWHLSREGCAGSDGKRQCENSSNCIVKAYCCFNA